MMMYMPPRETYDQLFGDVVNPTLPAGTGTFGLVGGSVSTTQQPIATVDPVKFAPVTITEQAEQFNPTVPPNASPPPNVPQTIAPTVSAPSAAGGSGWSPSTILTNPTLADTGNALSSVDSGDKNRVLMYVAAAFGILTLAELLK